MDIHFRASDIPVQTQGWLATLSHILSFVTTPTPGRGGIPLLHSSLYHLPDQAHQPHLISPAPGRPTTEGFCIEFSRENLPLGITVNKNSSCFHTTTSLCQHMPSTKGCFPQPRNMSKLRLSSAVPFSYPVFHSLQREQNNDCRPSFLQTSVPDVWETVMRKGIVNHQFTDTPRAWVPVKTPPLWAFRTFFETGSCLLLPQFPNKFLLVVYTRLERQEFRGRG